MATLAAANVLVTINKILNDTVSLIGNLLAIIFYIVFSPFICLIILVYPAEPAESAEPEELIELVESEEPEESKLNIRF